MSTAGFGTMPSPTSDRSWIHNAITMDHIQFVTGRLAEPALRRVVEQIAPAAGFTFTVDVLPITVAALMTPKWIARHIQRNESATRIIVPGYCDGSLDEVASVTGRTIELGPKDLRQLPEYFGQRDPALDEYGRFDIEIIAEINHAPRRSQAEVLEIATSLRDDGADIIDVGCTPGTRWTGVADCVAALRDAGHRVSIDSFDANEIELAVRAGAELVLSVNSTNREQAADWGCQVVVIPDEPHTMGKFDETVEYLARYDVPMRLDPILEPLGCGFAQSLARYLDVRRRYPDHPMMMGIGNLTELTDVDSAGINVLLLGFCQELEIRSVLTTQVINWSRTSVHECDLARRLVHFAVQQGRPPKHLEPNLVLLRDPKLYEFSTEQLDDLQASIKDRNYRIFVADDKIQLLSADLHLTGRDPFQLFAELMAAGVTNVDPSHAFYLGFELAKATTALSLGKQYEQDQTLDWGYLTVDEDYTRLTSKWRKESRP
jgi:dihydropteroate synthase